MRVILTTHTPDPIMAIARAARVCYSPDSYEEITDWVTPERANKLVKNIITSGHGSCLEHASFTFFIEGISRNCSHQLVRHRIGCSYEQRSQRYTLQNEAEFVTPETILDNNEARDLYKKALDFAYECYSKLNSMGIPKEDARYILPSASTTSITVTMTLRALRNFLELRLCNRAQTEIREMALEMYRLVDEKFPILMYNVGPHCITGVCSEIHKTPNCPQTLEKLKGVQNVTPTEQSSC